MPLPDITQTHNQDNRKKGKWASELPAVDAQSLPATAELGPWSSRTARPAAVQGREGAREDPRALALAQALAQTLAVGSYTSA